jgi:hypothetical protein
LSAINMIKPPIVQQPYRCLGGVLSVIGYEDSFIVRIPQ